VESVPAPTERIPSDSLARRAGMFVVALARRFYADQCLMYAAALAYTSLLSIVPLLALMFAVLKGLGVQNRLEPVLLSRLNLNQETTDLIISYIDRTNVSTLGTLGAAMLVVTVG
jgi:membrane protein